MSTGSASANGERHTIIFIHPLGRVIVLLIAVLLGLRWAFAAVSYRED
jgi:hypothetical protein